MIKIMDSLTYTLEKENAELREYVCQLYRALAKNLRMWRVDDEEWDPDAKTQQLIDKDVPAAEKIRETIEQEYTNQKGNFHATLCQE